MELHNNRAIAIIVELLKKHHIRHIVISPGGTNIQLIEAVQDDPAFTCYSVIDERSAMYVAIGIYLQTGEIVATSCTSAQATRNYLPGLTEAYYKRVPILAITMEKHPRFIYQEYMQAPDQTSLPKDSVKKSFEVPFISNVHDEYACIRIANEAIAELTHGGYGPVQLCIPRIDFGINETSPQVRSIIRCYKPDCSLLSGKKIMIVIGEHRPFTQEQKNAIEKFTESYDCFIYTNSLSNYKGKYSLNACFELTLMNTEEFAKEYAPDILISIGGQTGDYPFYLKLSKPELTSTEHWRISEDGKYMDTYDKLTRVYECSIEEFFEEASGQPSHSHKYYEKFNALCSKTDKSPDIPFSSAFVAQTLHDKMPKDSVIQFSILHSLRVWNLFDIDPSIACYSNVGAFGIDGGMSTLIGQSIVTDKLCFMIIGDLAFYYDMNSLGIRHIKNNVRILLVNNNGGVEFKLSDKNYDRINRYIAAANHYKNAKGWAETCGFEYLSVRNKDDFLKNYQHFISESDKPIVFELFISDKDDFQGYRKLLDANRKVEMTELLKRQVKRFIRR